MEHKDFIRKYFPEFYDEEFIKKSLLASPNQSSIGLLQSCMFKKAPEHLYHYTSVESLSSILKNESLWLFHYAGMNDPDEIIYGTKCIQDSIEEMFDLKEISKENAIDFLKVVESGLLDEDENTTCFSSFMSKPNHLPYWRWYGNDGEGVCIEFKTDSFWTRLYKVIYDKEKSKGLIKHISKGVADILTHRGLCGLESFFDCPAAIMKADHYTEEDEWRLLSLYDGDHMKKTFINGRVKKYIEIKFEEAFPITKIIIGPAASDEAKGYICDLVDNKIAHNIDIECSEIPYNNESILFESTQDHRAKLLKKLGAV